MAALRRSQTGCRWSRDLLALALTNPAEDLVVETNGEKTQLSERYAWYAAREKPLAQESEDWLAAQVDAFSRLFNAVEMCSHGNHAGYQMRSLRISEARNPPGWAMAICQAEKGKKRYVAFRVAELAPEAVLGMWDSIRDGSVTWKEEKPLPARSQANQENDQARLPRPV